MTKWKAVYLPSLNEGEDPSKDGFASREEAEDYASSHGCKSCQRDYRMAKEWEAKGVNPSKEMDKMLAESGLTYEDDGFQDICTKALEKYGESFTSCIAEWVMVESDKIKPDMDFGELLDAAGFKKHERK